MVILPESRDIRDFPYLDDQKGEQPERRAEALALAHSGSGQQRRYAARERLPSGRLGHALAK